MTTRMIHRMSVASEDCRNIVATPVRGDRATPNLREWERDNLGTVAWRPR